MAQLKDSVVSGNLRVTDSTLTDTLQVTTIKAPTSSGGTTYGPGISGQVLTSGGDGSSTYWGDANSHTHPYLPLSGGTMTGNITFTPVTSTSYPASSNQLYWSGSTDWAKIYYRVDAADAGKLVFDIGDDTNTRIAFAYNGTAKSYIDTDGNFSGNAANVTGTVAIANGGTGATTRLNALKNLTNENVGSSANYFLTITSSWGKGGYTSVADAKTVLGLKSAAYTESSEYAPSSHTHGNITSGGALQTTDITIANGDKLVVTDSSDSNKVARASISFDGSTTTKCLTQKGTWETFASSNTDTKVTQNIVATTTDKNYPLLLSYYESSSSTTTAQTANRAVGIYANAKTPKITLTSGTANTSPGITATRTDTNASVSLMVGSGGTNHGVYSESMSKWLFVTNGTEAQTYNITKNPSSAMTYAISFGGAGESGVGAPTSETFTTGVKGHYVNDGLGYRTREGVAGGTEGMSALVLGNSLSSSVANNKTGYVRLYSTNEYYTDLKPNTLTASRTILLPDAAGTIAVFPAARTSGRVVVTDGTAGGIKSSGYTIAKSVPSDAKFTDENVLQSDTSSTSDFRPILLGTTHTTTVADLSATITGQAYVSSNIFVKPNTGIICAEEFSTLSYINGTGAHLEQYGLYLKSYKAAALPAGGNYSYKGYVVRTYDGKSANNGGMLLTMDGGGLTIVGSGSASSLANLISDDQRDSNTSRTRLNIGGTLNTAYHGSSEYLILSSNKNIVFLTNCSTIADRKPVVLDTALRFYPGTTETGSIGISSYQWNTIYGKTIYENGTSLASKYAAIGHTHNYAGSSSAGGAATKSYKLIQNGTTRPTTANIACVGDQSVSLMQVSSSMTIGQPAGEGYILNFDWDTTSSWQSQLFIPIKYLTPPAYRAQNNNSAWADTNQWVNILTDKFGAGKDGYISFPGDGSYTASQENVTGGLVITLPFGMTSIMMTFVIDIFDYRDGDTVSYRVAGFNYDSNSKWYYCTAICIGKYGSLSSNLTVRFGHNGTKAQIQIGETTTAWKWPQVRIRDILLGHNATQGNKTYLSNKTGWTISFVTTNISNISQTITNTHIGYNCVGKATLTGDDSSDFASYPWHKFASITCDAGNGDYNLTLLVSKTWGSYGTNTGILTVHIRTTDTKIYGTSHFGWLLKGTDITADNFKLLYTDTANTKTEIELWYKQESRYDGWIFTVLSESNRATFTNKWVTYKNWGHGSASLPTATGTVPSSILNISNDENVKQSETTTNQYRPIVFGATYSTNTSELAATITGQTYVSNLLYAQPQNGMLHANIFEAGKAGTTDGEIKFYRSGSGNSGETTLKATAQSTSGTYLLPARGNLQYTLSCGHEDLSAPTGSLSAANVLIPSYTKFIKIVFKSDSSSTLYSMVEIPYFGNGDYSALVQVGTYGDGQNGSPRIVMKAVIIQIADGTQTGTKSFTITGSPTTKINGSNVSDYTRNITIHKIYAVD